MPHVLCLQSARAAFTMHGMEHSHNNRIWYDSLIVVVCSERWWRSPRKRRSLVDNYTNTRIKGKGRGALGDKHIKKINWIFLLGTWRRSWEASLLPPFPFRVLTSIVKQCPGNITPGSSFSAWQMDPEKGKCVCVCMYVCMCVSVVVFTAFCTRLLKWRLVIEHMVRRNVHPSPDEKFMPSTAMSAVVLKMNESRDESSVNE